MTATVVPFNGIHSPTQATRGLSTTTSDSSSEYFASKPYASPAAATLGASRNVATTPNEHTLKNVYTTNHH